MPLAATEQNRVQQLAVAFAAVPALAFLAWAYLAYMRAPAVGTFHDDGVYLVTAKALATGQGYRIVSLPGEPHQTKYPILFPWLLSLIWRIAPAFPHSLVWLRVVPFGAAIVWLYLAWLLVRRLGGSIAVAFAAVLLTAVSPWTLYLSTSLLSETLFAALLTGSVLLLTRITAGEPGKFAAAGAGALMGAAVLTRTIGLAPAVGGLLALAVRRRWSDCLRYVAVVALIVAPWIWWSARYRAEPIVDPFYAGSNYTSWNIVLGFPWSEKLAILGVNMFWMTQFSQYWGLPLFTYAAWATMLVCTALLARGFLIERASPAALVCAAYLAALLAWAFPPIRFVVAVLPLLVWLMFVGAGRFKAVLAVAAVALAVISGAAMRRQVLATQEKGGTWFNESLVDDWHAMRRQYDWISTNTSANDRVIATHDPTVYLFTGRQAIRPSTPDPVRLYYNVAGRKFDVAADAEALRTRITADHIAFIVVTPRDDRPVLDALRRRFPASFSIVDGTATSRFAIYRVDWRSLVI